MGGRKRASRPNKRAPHTPTRCARRGIREYCLFTDFFFNPIFTRPASRTVFRAMNAYAARATVLLGFLAIQRFLYVCASLGRDLAI